MGSFTNLRTMRKRMQALPGRPGGALFRQDVIAAPGRYRRLCADDIGDGDTTIVALPQGAALVSRDRPAVRAVPGGGRPAIRLGMLEIHPTARTVYVDGAPVELGGRAFDLLMVLLDAQGEIISKDDLLGRVWPTVTVVESNLKVQLSLLRRALGAERWRVKTISGRGYLLVIDDAQAISSPPLVPVAAPSVEQPLVIVVDADRTTRDLIVRALSEVTRYFGDASQVFLLPGSSDGRRDLYEIAEKS